MKKLSKIVALLLAGALTMLLFTACGGGGGGSSSMSEDKDAETRVMGLIQNREGAASLQNDSDMQRIAAAKLDEDEQKEIAEKAAAGENVRAKEIAEKVAEKKAGDDYETPHPESITSLCYSCQKYKDCNVKTGTCQKCDQYINKAEAEKTDEQRYSEEQDAIDRQTKKKLQERADTEKMEHLPSEGNIEHKQHELKIVASYYEDVISGKKSFELRKNDRGYKQGDSLKMLEFKDGKHTGRTIDADIIYMLEDYTGLTEGYCILGIRVTDYTGKVSETDTESGAEHE